jgi:hypothetical protein
MIWFFWWVAISVAFICFWKRHWDFTGDPPKPEKRQ